MAQRVKGLVVSQQWLGSPLWCGIDPRPLAKAGDAGSGDGTQHEARSPCPRVLGQSTAGVPLLRPFPPQEVHGSASGPLPALSPVLKTPRSQKESFTHQGSAAGLWEPDGTRGLFFLPNQATFPWELGASWAFGGHAATRGLTLAEMALLGLGGSLHSLTRCLISAAAAPASP